MPILSELISLQFTLKVKIGQGPWSWVWTQSELVMTRFFLWDATVDPYDRSLNIIAIIIIGINSLGILLLIQWTFRFHGHLGLQKMSASFAVRNQGFEVVNESFSFTGGKVKRGSFIWFSSFSTRMPQVHPLNEWNTRKRKTKCGGVFQELLDGFIHPNIPEFLG